MNIALSWEEPQHSVSTSRLPDCGPVCCITVGCDYQKILSTSLSMLAGEKRRGSLSRLQRYLPEPLAE